MQNRIKFLSFQRHAPIYTLNLGTRGHHRYFGKSYRYDTEFKKFPKPDAKFVVLGS